MKGFPNQIADLTKLAKGMACLTRLVDAGANAKDDGVFGQALVRSGVAGTGHTPRPIETYIREQLAKDRSSQGFRTTARGLRELYRLMGFIDDSGPDIDITRLGRRAATFANSPLEGEQVNFWRRVIRDLTHTDNQGVSHPYLVLLRLVARRPGITRAMCALALEAKNDSPGELDRIVALAGASETAVIRQIGATKSNWDNAKKMLPKFAEQLKDIIRSGDTFTIADSPGHADSVDTTEIPRRARAQRDSGVRAPRNSRAVTSTSIGRAGTVDRSDEVEIPLEVDPAAVAEGIRLRRDRLSRHNRIVQKLAEKLESGGAQLYEDPFDILALVATQGILVEVKTLDGTKEDERDRVRDALSQLLYYEGFVTEPIAGDAPIRKVACFEKKITTPHSTWLNGQGIAILWIENGAFVGDRLAGDILGQYL
jgi:hypothetical protein